jgi:pimeloyl-ACP methyl ester carboxylesterase
MTEVELSAGVLEYEDTHGGGPTVVLLHGLLMDEALWSGVVAGLTPAHRCVVPVLPMGAHRRPVNEDADLTLPGIARLVVEFLDRLDLHDVTLIGNDTGGAIVQLAAAAGSERVRRIGLVSCDAYDNFPPGLTGKTVVLTGRLPLPLFGAFMQQLRLKPVRRLPIAFGWLTKRGDRVTKQWIKTLLGNRGVRRDAVRVLRGVAANTQILEDVVADLGRFEGPALVAWASEDRVMPIEHGRRLAELLPQGRLVEIADSYTLIPLDQPDALADSIREFVAATAPTHPG